MTINYYSQQVYGQTLYYLANIQARNNWRELTGKKTITTKDMERLTALTGVTFTRVFEAED